MGTIGSAVLPVNETENDMTTIADHAFSAIQATERQHGSVDVGEVCAKWHADVDQDWDRERTTYTFDDGSHIVDEGDMGCWAVDGRIAFSPLSEQEDGQ